MKYILQPYKGMWSRYTCPQCHRHKVFSRYIDAETHQPIADHVGRCSRENNCGYHFKPSDYFGQAKNNHYDFSKDAGLWLGRKGKSMVDSPWTMDKKNSYGPSTMNYELPRSMDRKNSYGPSSIDYGLPRPTDRKNSYEPSTMNYEPVAGHPMSIGNIIKNNNLLSPASSYEPSTMDKKNSYGPSAMDHGLPPSLIAFADVNATFGTADYANNHFVQYLVALFGFDKADELVGRYRIGNSSQWPGATIFWQIDLSGKVRTGKIMLYNRYTGKRVKEPFNHITWVHSLLVRSAQPTAARRTANAHQLTAGNETANRTPPTANFRLQQCLFGEHLLAENPDAIVAIVESEKTAIIASAMLPGFVWLAAGSINNLNERICRVLQYRHVLLFPDLLACDKWKAKARTLELQLPGTTFKVFKELERRANDDEKRRGLDLADLVV